MVILGTPFINLITPYLVKDDCIEIKMKNKKVKMDFTEKPKTKNLNLIKAHSIWMMEINSIIKSITEDLKDLKNNVHLTRIKNQLGSEIIKARIEKLKNYMEKELCAEHPNAFWNKKQHIVDLPYE